MITLDLSILNQKGTPMFYSDITANRPAAGIAGRIFIATDSPYGLFRDTGSAWEQVAGSGGGGGISGSGAATQVAFWTGTSAISGSNNLWWDSTNNYFGIGTNTPGNPLDVHGSLASIAALNQTTATNNTLLSLLNSGTPLWRIGNFYTSAANDFGIFDVVGSLQQLTIVKTTGQTFIGAKTTASGRLVVNSATADAHLQIVGANSPSIRIDNAGSGGTQRFLIGNATATNNFIQGSAAGQFCITTASSGALLFGMWNTTNASEVMRITTAFNLHIGSTGDTGEKLQVTGSSKFNGAIIYNGITGAAAGSISSNGVSGLILWGRSGTVADFTVTDAGGTERFEIRGGTIGFRNPININNGNIRIGGTAGDGSSLYKASDSGVTILGNTSASVFTFSIFGDATNNGLFLNSSAQVKIGDYSATYNSSGILEVVSTTKGFLPPRMTTTQKNAIATPAAGLVVYDTTLNKLCVYTTAWETITSL